MLRADKERAAGSDPAGAALWVMAAYVLTIAVGSALVGYLASGIAWRSWLGSRSRQRRQARRAERLAR